MINRRLALLAAGASAAAFAVRAPRTIPCRRRRTPAAAAAATTTRRWSRWSTAPQRSAANKARDPWRHPLESLSFWGLQPGLTVVDIDPGGGYWTEILAPYLAQGGGRYIAGMADPNDPATSDERQARPRRASRPSSPTRRVYGPIAYAPFSAAGGSSRRPDSVDLILYLPQHPQPDVACRARCDKTLASFYRGAEARRRAGGGGAPRRSPRHGRRRPRRLCRRGLRDRRGAQGRLRASTRPRRSTPIPKDTKDHPFGVWTLPPTRRSAPEGQPPNPAFDHAKYDAIGESDRMTLRFRKPG